MSIKIGVPLIIAIVTFFLFGKIQTTKPLNTKKLKVTTSFYPLTFLAERIGGELVEITDLTPAGVEPHDFEPSTRDIAELEKQDIILLNGGGLEGYANKIQINSNQLKTSVVFVGQSLMNNSKNPHIWVDPVLYKREAEIVTAIFMKKDPIHKTTYVNNMNQLAQELDVLDKDFKKGLSNCKQDTIITSHEAFTYLAKRYKLQQFTLAGLSPEQEPSAKTLADIAQVAKTNKMRYIFFEELASPAVAETIAQEVGAQTLILNPLEGLTKEDEKAKKTYMSIQRMNMKNLRIALDCK